jgi:ABC-type glycerol-3-phosphate transport system substrate-binding protein
MSMKEKILHIVTMLILASLLITACASQTPPGAEPQAPQAETAEPVEAEAPQEPEVEATQPPEAEAPQEPEAEEPVKIGVYTVTWSKSSQEMMAKLIEMFNEEHQGKIEAEYIQGDWGEVDTYVTSGVAGGGGIADVIEIDTGTALNWYNQGFVTDLRPYITDEFRATMPAYLWDARTAEDGAVFMGGTVTGNEVLIYYNPELFSKAGVEPPPVDQPWTWDELIANAKLLTLDAAGKHLGEEGFDPNNVVQWGFLPRIDDEKVWEEGNVFVLQSTGSPMIRKGDDGTWDIFFDESGLPALKAYTSVIQEGVTPPMAIGLSGDSQNEAFAQGQAAMILRAFFNVAVIHDTYPDFEFSVMPIPVKSGGKYYVDNAGQGFAVPATSEHPEAAAEFIYWFQTATPNAMFANALALAPVNDKAWEESPLSDSPDWAAMRFYKSIEEVVKADYNVHTNEFVTTTYAPTMMAVVNGDMSLEEAVETIKQAAKDILNQP